ncbi:MAG TPA: MerR family transcriptional regulator [Anaerolineales bacterium]|nr:MerR family transcriptional regulator [Anaerolineales bacterium]
MALPKNTPSYNLKAVLSETGLKADTIRAWERRYGIPTPQRTEGGHRLYSRADIETLQWLVEQLAQGMSISAAVNLLKNLQETASQVLPAPTLQSRNDLSGFRQEWLRCCLNFNERGAEDVLNQAFAMFSVEQVCLEILQQGVSQLGNAWYSGKITAQQEHFTTALATRRVDVLLASCPPPILSEKILLGCPPDESHVFGLQVLTLLLRRAGYTAIYWGAQVPLSQLADSLQSLQPNLFILGAQRLSAVVGLQELAHYVSDLGFSVAFGGGAFVYLPELANRITGFYLGDELKFAVQNIRAILVGQNRQPKTSAPSVAMQNLRTQFRLAQEAIIQQTVSCEPLNRDPRFWRQISLMLCQNIDAVLALDVLEALPAEIHWIEQLVKNHGVPQCDWQTYHTHFQSALSQQLGFSSHTLLIFFQAE